LSPAGLLGPHGVAVDTDGSVLVADGLSAIVVRPDASVTKLSRGLVDQPWLVTAIVPAASGSAEYVMSTFPLGIVVWRPGGQPRVLDNHHPLDQPSGLVADPAADGRFLVCERGAGTVVSIGLDGTTQVTARALREPVAVTRDASGCVWVSQAGATPVVAIAPDGALRSVAELEGAEGLAAADGIVLVADVRARRLVAIDQRSAAVTTVVEDAPIGRPDGGQVPFAFCSVAAHPQGGFVIGCNGDGSVRWLRRE
jgi:sugar lactone lactonase YvrE